MRIRIQCCYVETEEERPSEEEVDGGNTRDVRDESGGAERCGRVSGLVEKIDHDSR